MRKVRCYECGKTYDYDTDDFCPKCGAFNATAVCAETCIPAERKTKRESAACGGQADLLDLCGHHRAEYPQFFSRTFADVVTGFHPFE